MDLEAQKREAAARAVQAGNDVVLHSPDDAAAVAGIKAVIALVVLLAAGRLVLRPCFSRTALARSRS